MTAAHVLADKNQILYKNTQVNPSWNLLGPTPRIMMADYAWDSSYFTNPNATDAAGKDLGFIRIATPNNLSLYPQIWLINESGDFGAVAPPYHCLGGITTDAYAIRTHRPNEASSWAAVIGFFDNGRYDCGPVQGFISAEIVGYPLVVQGVENQQLFPYRGGWIILTGSKFGNPQRQYQLFRNPEGTLFPSVGTSGFVSEGNSGGPIFGRDDTGPSGSPTRWILLGVVSSAVAENPYNYVRSIGPGRFRYNDGFVTSNQGWTPAELVKITSPQAGRVYRTPEVPNLIGSAGEISSQLEWTSSLDGDLGTGANVPAAGRLRPGNHTITAVIPGSNLAKRSIDIFVLAAASTFIVTPTTVVVGALSGPQPYKITYNSPSYQSLDWQRSVNGGAYQFLMTTGNNGVFNDTIAGGVIYRYKVFPHGDTANVLGTPSVTGQVAPAPSITLSPSIIDVPNGVSSGNVTITWSAPGYSGLDWCGKVNSGPWAWGGLSTPAMGNTTQPVPVGTTYGYRFYPLGKSGGCGSANLLKELSVTARRAAAPTFSVNPSHVIVPAGATSGNTTITWSAPGYSGLDWCGKVNSGPWAWGGLSTPAMGNTTQPVPVGTTYGYRFYPPGGASGCSATTKLGELTVYASR